MSQKRNSVLHSARIQSASTKRRLFPASSKKHRVEQLPLTPKSVDEYTEEELQEYRQVFSLFDTDGSGSIGIDELQNAMKSLGMNPSQHELENLIREVDQDGNGEIDFDEFCNVMKKLGGGGKKLQWHEVVKQCFDVFDRHENGCIPEEDFRHILKHLGRIPDDTVIDEIFAEFDVDGNGVIDYNEFTSMVKNYMTDEDLQSKSANLADINLPTNQQQGGKRH